MQRCHQTQLEKRTTFRMVVGAPAPLFSIRDVASSSWSKCEWTSTSHPTQPQPRKKAPWMRKKKKTANTWHIQRHEKQCFLHVAPHRKEENQTSSKLCQQISASIQITSQTKNIWPQFLYAFHLVFFNDNCPQPFCKTLLLPTFRSCTCTKLAWNFPLSQAKDLDGQLPCFAAYRVMALTFDMTPYWELPLPAWALPPFFLIVDLRLPELSLEFFCYLWWRLDIFFCFLFWALWSKNLKHVRDFSFSQASEKTCTTLRLHFSRLKARRSSIRRLPSPQSFLE